MIKPSTSTRPQLSPQATQQLLDRLLPLAETPPVCLWGRHGIGKTTLIKDWAAAKGWPLVMISPAQFEEMGDLLGLPYLQEEGDRKTTVLAPPQWAPQAAGPGVLLLDDFNRADGRIIRGLMNLLLEGQLNSWRLPAGWKIVLTANPEEQEYIVTPLDEAILGRMLHLEVTFSLDSWVGWARQAGLPAIGITFVQQFPGALDGRRSTARSFTQFLRLWQAADTPTAEDEQLSVLANSLLAAATAEAFVQFLRFPQTLPTPAALFDGKVKIAQILDPIFAAETPHLERLQSWEQQLLNWLMEHPNLTSEQASILSTYLQHPQLPAANKLLLLRALGSRQHAILPKLLQLPDLAQLLIG